MTVTTFDPTIASSKPQTKKTARRVAMEALTIGNDGYDLGMAVQEFGQGPVIIETATQYMNRGVAPADAFIKAGNVVGHYTETMENGGIFKTVRANLKSARTLKA